MPARILVINDEESILDLFRMILESEGYEFCSSTEAIENVTAVEELDPDLIILDLKLGMQEEGWLTMQKIRMYPPTQKIPIILCTAALEEAREQEETLQDKGIPIIYKPFDVDELLEVVQRMLPFPDTKSPSRKKQAP
ncbi:hypothetical protein KSC_065910 [Ktedonobacter sp. SOSP1-52]|uniref:response regulator n=1 Tax=Ktedonobacter sp. SOSP1-52 TaxID=2778366 RepID=UPI0019156A27|nr:response regulator [Ktedonobacter sp. SOSP1-52]GHO67699.1 hypothetical protein KSC_065910 [Ktedonobacter sp. SOSP1-52]